MDFLKTFFSSKMFLKNITKQNYCQNTNFLNDIQCVKCEPKIKSQVRKWNIEIKIKIKEKLKIESS